MDKEKLKAVFLVAKDRLIGAAVGSTSVMITYYLLLSLFPMIIAVGNILPLFGINAAAVMGYLDMIIPQPLLPWLLPIIESLLGSTSGALLSFSLLTGIWSASRGVNFLQKGMNKAYGIPDKGSFITRRLVAMVTILLILLLLVAFALVFSFGEALAEQVAGADRVMAMLQYWKWPVMIVFIFLMLMIVYRVTPDVKLRLRQVWPGALLATAGLLILVQLFTFYLSYVTRTLSSYGALGAFFLLMVWVNFSVRIVLVGAVLNASIGEYYHGPAQEVQSRMDNAIDKWQARLWAWLGGLFTGKRKAPPETPDAEPDEATKPTEAPPEEDGDSKT